MFNDELLTMEELCERIKYKRQSIYNLIYKKKLLLGIHFHKPSRKKLLFKWSAMSDWIGDDPTFPFNPNAVSNSNDGKSNNKKANDSPVENCRIFV